MYSYIVVADAGQARLLRVSGPTRARHVEETEKMERPSLHPQANEAAALPGEKPHRPPRGRAGQSSFTATTPHDTRSDFDPHAGEVVRFAKHLSQRLDALHKAGGIDDFILLAEPRFLGELRKQLTDGTRRIVSRELPRDFVHADTKTIVHAAFPQ
jgi:protein required for attachment to host cells